MDVVELGVKVFSVLGDKQEALPDETVIHWPVECAAGVQRG
jgi:hypothetical protein